MGMAHAKEREVAHSYALALYELGAEEGPARLDRLEEDLERAWERIRGSELLQALRHPLITRQEKLELLREVFAGEIDKYVLNLLLVATERGRIAHLPAIIEEFRELREGRERLLYVTVETPYPLDGLREEIAAKLAELTGREVRLRERLNQALIGGVRLHLRDYVLDGSLATQLERLRERLLESGLSEV